MIGKDKEIIKLMRNGKRLNISEIARELDMPTSTVNDAIKRLEEKYGVKHSSLLDYSKLDYAANAQLAVKISSMQKEEFLGFVKSEKCVNSIHHVDPDYDFLLEIVFKDAIKLKEWVEMIQIRFSAEVNTFHILKTEKKEEFVP